MNEMNQIQAETSDSMRQNFLNFAGMFSEKVKKGLTIFYDQIVNHEVIPYKIKNREWEVLVVASTAYTLKLTFHNVIIEDGRHPREILMTTVYGENAGEEATGGYRIRFINALITEGIIKESSFTFDDITVEMRLWNYNYNCIPFSPDTDKVPWRLIYTPLLAFEDKWKIFGEDGLCDDEIENAIMIQFMSRFLDMYLDEKTSIGYGKSTLSCDREKLQELSVTKRMLRAGRRLFELCQWQDLAEQVEQFEDDRFNFFASFVMRITNKEGRLLYDYMNSLLNKCSYIYEEHPMIVALQGEQYDLVKRALNSLFNQNGYKGFYPDFYCKEKPKFIETSFVYERKYTYINARQKMHIVSFIENYMEDGIQICAIHGHLLSKGEKDKSYLKQAMHCYFSDDGKRSAGITDSLFITPDMDIEELKEDVIVFFERCILPGKV